MLDDVALSFFKIVASNRIDEDVIRSLNEQNSPIDGFGIGPNLVTGHSNAALDGVYKLSACDGKPTLKISENTEKINHQKLSFSLSCKAQYRADFLSKGDLLS